MSEQKQYTGLQKILKQISGGGLDGYRYDDPTAALAATINVSRATILKWLRQDGVSLNEPKAADSALARAVTAHGGPVAVAKVLGVTYQAVTQWIAQGYVPLKRVPEFEIQFGVPRADLVSPKVRNATGAGGEL